MSFVVLKRQLSSVSDVTTAWKLKNIHFDFGLVCVCDTFSEQVRQDKAQVKSSGSSVFERWPTHGAVFLENNGAHNNVQQQLVSCVTFVFRFVLNIKKPRQPQHDTPLGL